MVIDGLVDVALWIPALFLVLSRIAGIMITAPLFGSTSIPRRVKIALALAVTVTVFPAVLPELPPDLTLGQAVSGLPGEIAIGLIIGVGLSLLLLALQIMGHIVGQQAGLTLASVFDPNTETESSIIGQIYFMTAMSIFLAVGGHRAALQILLETFRTIPVMTFGIHEGAVTVITELMQVSLTLALRVGGPAVLALLLAKAALGFLSRTIPQLHILSVGFALFVSIGILISGLEMDHLEGLFFTQLDDTLGVLGELFGVTA